MNAPILIVDDEASIVEGLTALLQLENFDCAGASDRASADAMLRSRFYPVILADVRLRTEEEGLRLLEDIKRISPGSRVISMTGYGTPQLEAEVLGRGSSRLLMKPMPAVEILSAIATILDEIEQLAAAKADVDLDELYAEVKNVLYAIPQRQYGLTADESEDIVQEAWLLFLERRGWIRNDGAWLAGAVKNLSRRQIDRSRRNREKFCSTTAVENLSYLKNASPDNGIALQTVLSTLDVTSRSLCTLIAIEGYSYDEVSLSTGLPVGSIGPMYVRAKKKMRSSAALTTSRKAA